MTMNNEPYFACGASAPQAAGDKRSASLLCGMLAKTLTLVLAGSLPFAVQAGSAGTDDVVIHNPRNAAIAAAVEVPAGNTVVYLSGKLPQLLPGKTDRTAVESYGNTEQQSMSVFAQIEEQLNELGLDSGNVIKMTIFLVADPATGSMDFAGMMNAYRAFYGTQAQPNVPARSTVEVAALANPAALVEVEVIAVRP